MPAIYNVDRPGERGGKRHEGIGDAPRLRWQLLDERRRDCLIRSMARQDGNRRSSPSGPAEASALKRSRLYCAMPPCPPKASVTKARMLGGDFMLPATPRARSTRRRERPATSAATPSLWSLAPSPGLGASATASIHFFVGTPKPVFARRTISSGSGSVGALASAAFPSPGTIAPSTGAMDSSSLASTKRHANFNAVGHARPVGVAKKLVAHVMRRFKRADPRRVRARIGHEAGGKTL